MVLVLLRVSPGDQSINKVLVTSKPPGTIEME
jgi:GMP synthase PP-ATPase subunit